MAKKEADFGFEFKMYVRATIQIWLTLEERNIRRGIFSIFSDSGLDTSTYDEVENQIFGTTKDLYIEHYGCNTLPPDVLETLHSYIKECCSLYRIWFERSPEAREIMQRVVREFYSGTKVATDYCTEILQDSERLVMGDTVEVGNRGKGISTSVCEKSQRSKKSKTKGSKQPEAKHTGENQREKLAKLQNKARERKEVLRQLEKILQKQDEEGEEEIEELQQSIIQQEGTIEKQKEMIDSLQESISIE